MVSRSYFFFNDTATTEIYTLSLHDALPIFGTLRFYLLSHPDHVKWVLQENAKNYSKGYDRVKVLLGNGLVMNEGASWLQQRDRKSTRLNSSHANISYAVFCLKKKKPSR